MQGELSQISKLQAIESRILELKVEIAELPRQIAAIEKQLEAHVKKLDAEKATLAEAQKERRQRDLDIQTFQAKIAKLKDQMNSAKTNEQFRAFQHEIEFAEKEIRNSEDRILALMTETEPLEKNVKAAETELAAEKKGVDERKVDAQKRAASDQKEVNRLAAERQQLLKELNPPVLKAYERARRKYARGAIIAEVVEGKCTACQIMLRPQYFQDLKAADTGIMFCESCGRILHWNPPVSVVSMS